MPKKNDHESFQIAEPNVQHRALCRDNRAILKKRMAFLHSVRMVGHWPSRVTMTCKARRRRSVWLTLGGYAG